METSTPLCRQAGSCRCLNFLSSQTLTSHLTTNCLINTSLLNFNSIPPSINQYPSIHPSIHIIIINQMKMKMNYYFGIMILVVCVALSGGGGGGVGVCRAQQSLAEQCSAQLPQVMTCVAFASGKETTPQQKCCDSVKGMKESNPACLCFLIQQIHNGTNPALQKMNIQEAHLLQLPSALVFSSTVFINQTVGFWINVYSK